jgi:mitochondrial inner membrane protease subunit 1
MPFPGVPSAGRIGCCLERSRSLTGVNLLPVRCNMRIPPTEEWSCVRTLTGKATDRSSSRKEKRRLTKALKRKAKESMEPGPVPQSSSWWDRFYRLVPLPRIPGGASNFKREHFLAVGKRLPFWLLLAILISYDDTSPFVLDRTRGPSMLPTIFPLGDLYLRDTGAWHRALGIGRSYQVGDVVAFPSPNGHGYSCKRIVAVEGDKVLRFGQFAHVYNHREDLGIVAPHRPGSYNLSWDEGMIDGKPVKDISYIVIVPPGHVWLEGDFPLFSVDSRHYGPLPLASIRGRLLMRLWPLWREEGVQSTPIFVSRERPEPLTREAALAGGYNLSIRKAAPR